MINAGWILRRGFAVILIALWSAAPLAAQELEVLPARIAAPSLSGGGEWINTSESLDLPELRGKFVVLDFWTYCCINCMHVLPELKKLEEEFPQHVVVIGVHSAKFQTERDAQNVLEAVERYGIEHPVVNDPRQVLWSKYAVDTWPSLRVIDPEGQIVAHHKGEFTAEMLAQFLRKAIPVYRKKKVLDETPIRFDAARPARKERPLLYPGKVLADAESGRLFVADTGHNRIVVAKLTGEVQELIGNGAQGHEDGPFEQATFDHPQGLALKGDMLYVADTQNHMLRKVDLKNRRVTTLAGTGEQSRVPIMRSAVRPLGVKLASPWDLWVHGNDLYIAMAGTHQIWLMSLDTGSIGPFAGNAVEDIIDGPALPPRVSLAGYASFAQPSGLASDGVNLFIADSEGSSIRAVPMRAKADVTTLLGTAGLPAQRLFTFGDRDGVVGQALLQHPLGVAYRDKKVYIADTYNSKIKELDLKLATVRTIAGDGRAGSSVTRFDEPGGLSIAGDQIFVADTNNHAIRMIDLAQDITIKPLELKGLRPPLVAAKPIAPPAPSGKRLAFKTTMIKPEDEQLKVAIDLALPPDFKLNPDAPLRYFVHAVGNEPLVSSSATGKWLDVEGRESEFEISLPLQSPSAAGPLTISLAYYYCRSGATGICKAGEITWTGRIMLSDKAVEERLELKHMVGK
jgi:thiol-disulfide isomerase/thioredoxin